MYIMYIRDCVLYAGLMQYSESESESEPIIAFLRSGSSLFSSLVSRLVVSRFCLSPNHQGKWHFGKDFFQPGPGIGIGI